MRRSTGLHANQAGWQRFEELRHLRPTKLFSDRDVLGRVNAVDLKYVLRDVQTDRGNLHVDGSPPCDSSQRTTLWHFDARSGRRPPHQTLPSRAHCSGSASPQATDVRRGGSQVSGVPLTLISRRNMGLWWLVPSRLLRLPLKPGDLLIEPR